MKPIGHIHTKISGKFGIPRQSGVIPELSGVIVFEPEYRTPDAFRGLEEFSHIWLIWQFSEAVSDDDTFSATVRPPRLGGNTRMGVFATRSPFRPNNIGISAVKLTKIDFNANDGPVLFVSGIDLMDGTPIYDVKPYLRYADSIPEASDGFTETLSDLSLSLEFPEQLLCKIPENHRKELQEILKHDPRPGYQKDPERIYGLTFAGFNIKFRVSNHVLTVFEVDLH